MSQVTVYSSNMCSTCEMVKQFLVLRGVEFTEKNVSTDLEGRSELVAMGFDVTPVTVIGEQDANKTETIHVEGSSSHFTTGTTDVPNCAAGKNAG